MRSTQRARAPVVAVLLIRIVEDVASDAPLPIFLFAKQVEVSAAANRTIIRFDGVALAQSPTGGSVEADDLDERRNRNGADDLRFVGREPAVHRDLRGRGLAFGS